VIRAEKLRRLYANSPHPISRLYAPNPNNPLHHHPPSPEKIFMSVLDGLSLCLAIGLFLYLITALLRAGQE
jgi:K+-transporting ATPase KdpF subunit